MVVKKEIPDLEELREWFRSSNDVRTGYIAGATFGLRPIRYAVIDGRGIFEGDICLGDPESISRMPPGVQADQLSARGIAHGIGVTGEQLRWPGGRVAFEIDGQVPQNTRTTINSAIQHWEQNTGIRFVQRTPANAGSLSNFVRFISGGGCWSYVGMRGGMQELSLGAGCGFGAAVHEIGHAVGLWHEQSREDRDQYVRIHWENIQSGTEHNFDQHITDGDDIGAYDFDSIMHYGAYAFSANGQATIETLGGQQIGQRNGLSAGDIQAVRALYPQLEAPPQTTRLFRYYSGAAGDHFYTTSWAELGQGRSGYVYEGVACYIFPSPATGTQPLFRYYKHQQTKDHFYTTNWAELGAGRAGYALEGIQGYLFPSAQPGTVPLYRYYSSAAGDHFYTTNWNELGSGSGGWRYEGIAGYVHQLPPAAAAMEEGGQDDPSRAYPHAFAYIDDEIRNEAQPEQGAMSSPDQVDAEPGSGAPQGRKGRAVTLRIDLD